MSDSRKHNSEAARRLARTNAGARTNNEHVERHEYYQLDRLTDDKYRNEERVAVGYFVREIPADAFRGCPNLVAVEICLGTTEFGDRSFSDCPKLEEINIPSTTRKIGNGVFEGSNNLRTIDVEGDVLWQYQRNDGFQVVVILDRVLHGFYVPRGDCKVNGKPIIEYSEPVDIEIPDDVYRIENGTFTDCSTLVKVEIPESVREIGDSVFENCVNMVPPYVPSPEAVKRYIYYL